MKPILFSTPMVQAILEGRKIMSRRTKGLEVLMGSFYQSNWVAKNVFNEHWEFYNSTNDRLVKVKCPYGKPGDVLWVREKWKPKYVKGGLYGFKAQYPGIYPWFYAADGESEKGYGSWKPSIHMPKEACRLRLLIKSIRVERLQDITEEDAKAEGANPAKIELAAALFNTTSARNMYRYGFQALWQSINGPESWEANPWVWVIEFEKIDKPIL